MVGEQKRYSCEKFGKIDHVESPLSKVPLTKMVSLVARPLSVFCRYRKRTGIKTHLSSKGRFIIQQLSRDILLKDRTREL